MRNNRSRPCRTSTLPLATFPLLALTWLACAGPGSVPVGLDGKAGATSIGISHGTAGTSASAGSDGTGRAGTSGLAGTTGAAAHGGAGETTGGGELTGEGESGGVAGKGGANGTAVGTGGASTSGSAGSTSKPGTGGVGGSAASSSAAGTTGKAGTTGAAGTVATAGSAGTTGRAGRTGAAGTATSSGSAGTGGGAGTTGVLGSAGSSGLAGIGGGAGDTGSAGTSGTSTVPGAIQHVFVIAMENEPSAAIYGNKKTPYLNGLAAKYARATAFTDPLSDSIPSEPHYIWMEAGTNKFSDVTFTDDSDPSSSNSTKSTAHLVTQMMAASPAVSWMGLMEGLNDAGSGACPISSYGFYAAKHDPFVFFQDVVGKSPSESNALCSAHHKAFTTGQAAVAGTVAQYTFISPNLCNDMHGDPECPSSASDVIATGDAWLAANLPPIVDYVNAHAGVIFIVWDEPEGGSNLIPFFAIGPVVKSGYTSTTAYTHSSLLKTVEEIFGLPVLPTVAGANDFADLFESGTLR